MCFYRLVPVHKYLDMTPRINQQSMEDQNIQLAYQHRPRTSSFPGARGGSFLAIERNPSIFSFREQEANSSNVCSHSFLNIQHLEEHLPNRHDAINKYKTSSNSETNPHRKKIVNVKKKLSSSRLQLNLTAALFLFAFVTGMDRNIVKRL